MKLEKKYQHFFLIYWNVTNTSWKTTSGGAQFIQFPVYPTCEVQYSSGWQESLSAGSYSARVQRMINLHKTTTLIFCFFLQICCRVTQKQKKIFVNVRYFKSMIPVCFLKDFMLPNKLILNWSCGAMNNYLRNEKYLFLRT